MTSMVLLMLYFFKAPSLSRYGIFVPYWSVPYPLTSIKMSLRSTVCITSIRDVVKSDEDATCLAWLLSLELEIIFIARGTAIIAKIAMAIKTSTREKPLLFKAFLILFITGLIMLYLSLYFYVFTVFNIEYFGFSPQRKKRDPEGSLKS